ncbi:hypothetical protein PoB_000378900 [Plakobranchus ocellatus]|uniref:Uncharacterized protein n=1 Tax=Plakobranchus ocellatus TaxID=259542 RepID=A0AAV3Y4Z1_9GAST|nr:hypothetical protein PoB_000378900 [Plakobranchus ocellatus]
MRTQRKPRIFPPSWLKLGQKLGGHRSETGMGRKTSGDRIRNGFDAIGLKRALIMTNTDNRPDSGSNLKLNFR